MNQNINSQTYVSMKTQLIRTRTVLLGIAGLALNLQASLQAQVFTYNTRDLVLAFRRSGSSDLEVDLGSIDTFKSANQTLSLNNRFDLNTQLLPTFGDLNSLTFSVFGAQRGTGSDPANTSWLSLKRTDPNVQTAAPNGYTSSKSQNIQSAISGILGDGASSGSLVYAPSAGYPPSSSTALIVPTAGTAAANSYTTKYTAVGGLASLVAAPGVEITTGASFSTTPNAIAALDLYQYLPGTTTQAASLLGTFTFDNTGALSFVPVPEPSTWALFGLGGLLLIAWQRHHRFPYQTK